MQTNPVSGKACSPTKGGLICYIYNLYSHHKLPSLLFAYLFISVLRTVTLLPPLRSLVPRLGLGNTWVRQLRSGSCHYPTAATKCKASLLANKPRQWKSMLTHQGWFNLLIYATFTRTTNYRVCYLHIYLYPCSAPSHIIGKMTNHRTRYKMISQHTCDTSQKTNREILFSK